MIDNWRVLHGREEFEGYRNLRGCYVGRDDIDSTKGNTFMAPSRENLRMVWS